jgi:hypothetical protein
MIFGTILLNISIPSIDSIKQGAKQIDLQKLLELFQYIPILLKHLT